MDAARFGGYALLVSAGAGVVASVVAPRRWGRAGGACVTGGLSVLAARDTVMIVSGSLRRLQVMPGVLLVAEPVCASAGIALGGWAWLGKDGVGVGPLNRLATVLAVTSFAIHAIRQVIYLTPGRGRRLTGLDLASHSSV
jgi:hypothetical protein